MKPYRFGVLGAGNMGLAIASGAVRSGKYRPEEILLFNRGTAKQSENEKKGFAVTGDFRRVYAACETVLLSVKPQNFAEILPALAAAAPTEKPLVISIAAGVPFARIEQALGADIALIRVMPNTPLLLGQGASALVKNGAATAQQLTDTAALFGTMGVTAVFGREEMLNEVIPYNGSLPAYAYQFMNAFLKSAAQHGIAPEQAKPLICKTMIGAAEMMLSGTQTPDELIRAVCSPGGTTIEGVQVFEAHDLDAIVAEASDKCIARAYELGK